MNKAGKIGPATTGTPSRATLRHKAEAGRSRDLSDDEKAIVDLLVRGCSDPNIAFALGVSEAKVKENLRGVRRKLGVIRRLDIVRLTVTMQAARALQNVRGYRH